MAEKQKGRKIALVRVRGKIDVRQDTKDTMETMLHLRRVNWATVIDDTPIYMGMVNKIKDYITWGEIDEPTFAALVEKWGRKAGDKRLETGDLKDFPKKFMAGEITFKEAGIRPYFKLHPPTHGHERAGIKKHIAVGGVLGNRRTDINALLIKMAGLRSKDGAKK